MKRLLLSTLFLFFAVAAFAQKGAVSGTVLDADTGESVAGAVLEVAPVKTPDQKQYFTSGYKGAVAIPSLPYGEYRLTVSLPSTKTFLICSPCASTVPSDTVMPGIFFSSPSTSASLVTLKAPAL